MIGGLDVMPYCIKRNGRFYPVVDFNDRVWEIFGSDHIGGIDYDIILTDIDISLIPEIDLKNGDQFICVNHDYNLYSHGYYAAEYVDTCSRVFYDWGTSPYHRFGIVDYGKTEEHPELTEINGTEITQTSSWYDCDGIAEVLEKNGLRPHVNELAHSILVCGNMNSRFTSGGYVGMQYQEVEGVVDSYLFHALAPDYWGIQSIMTKTKEDYAIINLPELSNGIYVIDFTSNTSYQGWDHQHVCVLRVGNIG